MFAHKEAYICLGLLILSIIFDKRPREVILKINHMQSDIKYFKISNNFRGFDNLELGLNSMPYAFSYYPEKISKHPFIYTSIEISNLPWFSLTNEIDCLIHENEWKQRNTIIGCGRDEGSAYFAELLLNFGLLSNELTTIELEGECGFRGVGRGSIEMSLFLPGHLFWTNEHWQ